MKEPEEYKIEKAFLEIHNEFKGANESYPRRTKDGNVVDIPELLSKFKTYLIEQGEHVNAESASDLALDVLKARQNQKPLHKKINSIEKRIKEIEKEVQQYRDNTFKVVSDEEIKIISEEVHDKWIESAGWCVGDAILEMGVRVAKQLTGKA